MNTVAIQWDEWHDAPIIVTENAQKDALNEYAAIGFAQRSGKQLHWYYAVDTHRGQPVSEDIRNHLFSLNSGMTNQRLGKIPLVIGMPVMITQNYDVEGGVVNGCVGILKKIRYIKDSNDNRIAYSCIIESATITSDPLSTLPKQHAVILQDTVDLRFRHPHSGKNCQIKRTQLPVCPAFAMTAHKSQGQTMTKVIIDLQSCRGTEAPYVMLSRVTSLKGLLILRPFDYGKISCHQSQDTRAEFKRLEKLCLQTLAEIGNPLEKEMVIKLLSTFQNSTSNHIGLKQKKNFTRSKNATEDLNRLST